MLEHLIINQNISNFLFIYIILNKNLKENIILILSYHYLTFKTLVYFILRNIIFTFTNILIMILAFFLIIMEYFIINFYLIYYSFMSFYPLKFRFSCKVKFRNILTQKIYNTKIYIHLCSSITFTPNFTQL